MNLQVRKLLSQVRSLVPHAPALVRAGLNRLDRFLTRRLNVGKQKIKTWKIYKKLAASGLSKARSEIKFFSKILKSMNLFTLHTELEEGDALRLCKTKSAPKPSKVLVGRDEFEINCKKLMSEGRGRYVLAFYIMIASGRRLIDVSRITSNFVRRIDLLQFYVRLSHDKSTNSAVHFTIDFDSLPIGWSLFTPAVLAEQFSALIGSTPTPFSGFSAISWAREISFHVHDLRSIKALSLTLAGASNDDICATIGWRCHKSLNRYRQLSRGEILKIGSLDLVLVRINGICKREGLE